MTRELIEDIREIVLPFLRNVLSKTNYENLGKSDAEEFTRDFNEILDLAIKALEQEPFINKPCVSSRVCEHDKNDVLDKIRAEITDCLKTLDEIEKSGFNIYLPNEMSGRRLTYRQCLEFVDKYKAETEAE